MKCLHLGLHGRGLLRGLPSGSPSGFILVTISRPLFPTSSVPHFPQGTHAIGHLLFLLCFVVSCRFFTL